MTGLGVTAAASINKASKPDYGNFSNRLEYGFATAGNYALAGVEATAASVAVTAAGYGAIKSKAVQKALVAIPDGLAKLIGKLSKNVTLKGLVDKILKASPKGKALASVAALGTALGALIISKRSHKQGVLDQKYRDRAQLTNIVDVIK